MKENAEAIHRLVNRAEQLAEKLQHDSPQFVLCHSDIHGGNVLIDQHNFIYIVDWDAPMMAPKERDLMFIGGGVANVWNKPHEEEAFYKGYGKAEVNIDLASRMTDGTFEALCQDVQSYTTNESGWSLTKSYVVENILHIEAQDETSDDTISWLVIGERNDDGIKNSAVTDEYGHVIVEELKPEEGL